MGTLVGGVLLAILGAVLAFAVQDSINGVDLTMIGYILLVGGAVLTITGIVLSAKGNRVRSTVRSTGPEGDRVVARDDKIS